MYKSKSVSVNVNPAMGKERSNDMIDILFAENVITYIWECSK